MTRLCPVHHMYERVADGRIYGIAWGGGLGTDGLTTPPCDTEDTAREELRRRLAAVGRRPAVPADYPLPIDGSD